MSYTCSHMRMVLREDKLRMLHTAGSGEWRGEWEKETSSKITKDFHEKVVSWDEHKIIYN